MDLQRCAPGEAHLDPSAPFKLHVETWFFFLLRGKPAKQPSPHRQLLPFGGRRTLVCACAGEKGGGGCDENDICQRECQHMGVPVVRDRCLTEEVREGPGFPSCLLCSLPIAQRNTLSEEQREKGKGGGGRPQRRRESQRPIPPGFGCWGAEDYQMNGPLHTHPPLQA